MPKWSPPHTPLPWLTGLAVLACAAPTNAQQTAPRVGEDSALEEVIVRGQKLALELQDVASSVVVVSGDDLDQPAYSDIEDYLRDLPNVLYDSGGTAPTVRGVYGGGVAGGADGAISGGRPRLTTYVDGVPRSFSFLPNGVPLTWDVEQLEFYRGAQSMGIGRNAIAGAIVVTTTDPVDEFEWAAQLGVRSEDTTTSGALMLNVPLVSDRLALRVTADGHEGESFVDYAGPDLGPFNESIRRDEGHRIRAKLEWHPEGYSQETSVKLAYEQQQVRRPSPEDVVDLTGDATLTNPFVIASFQLDNELLSLELRKRFNEHWSLYGITSYQEASETGPSIDPANPAFYLDVFADSEEWTQELRLNYESVGYALSSRPVTAAIGAFYFARDRIEGGTPGSAFPYDATDEASTLAGFFDAVIPVGPIDLLAGGRWEREHQDRDFTSAAFGIELDYDRSQSIFLPKGGLRLNIDDDRSLTALYYRGYSPAAAGFSAFALNPAPYTFERETSDTVELAWRSRSPERGITFNANLFETRYRGQQLTEPGGDFRIVNATRTRYRGVEADITWRASELYEVDAAIGLLDTAIVSFGTPEGNAFNGNELGFAPGLTARIGLTWNATPALQLAATARYSGEYYTYFDNEPADEVPDAATLDLRARFDYRALTLFAYAENVFDRFYATSIDTGFGTRNIARPRTIGLAVRVSF